MKVPHCPTCKGLPVRYREHWSGEVKRWEADGTGRPVQRVMSISAEPERVDAVCARDHEWTVRGVRSVREIH